MSREKNEEETYFMRSAQKSFGRGKNGRGSRDGSALFQTDEKWIKVSNHQRGAEFDQGIRTP